MPEEPTVATIEVTVHTGAFSPSGMRLDLQVNSFPVVRYTHPRQSDAVVVAPLAADALDAIRELQTARLEGRDKPDVNVQVNDGTGGEVTTEGYVSAPVLETTNVSTTENFSAVGVDARLDALDLSIYDAGTVAARKEKGSTDVSKKELEAIAAAKVGDLAGTLKAVTEMLVAGYEQTLSSIPYRDSRVLVEIQHEINTSGTVSPLDIWYMILDNSDVKFKAWDKAMAKQKTLAKDLTNHIKELLQAKTSGFWGKLRSLMADFHMYYVPSFSESGKLIRADSKVGDADYNIEVSASITSFADGDPRMLQPGGVVMVSPGAPAARKEKERNKKYPQIYAYYPSPLKRGFIQREVPPFWLRRSNGYPLLGSELKKGTKVNLSLAEYKKRKKAGEDVREAMDESIGGVMTEICEVMFAELQLAHSSVALTLPLNLAQNAHIGKRVTITVLEPNGAGGSFDCFVAGVTHSVDLRNGKQLSSYTQIRCTHVKF